MKKKYLILVFTIVFNIQLMAQSSFFIPINESSVTTSPVQLSMTGDFIYSSNIYGENNINPDLYTNFNSIHRLDSQGQEVYSRYYVHEEDVLGLNFSSNWLREDAQGSIFLSIFKDSGNNSEKGLAKVDVAGEFVWYRKLLGGFSSSPVIFETIDNNIVVTMSNFFASSVLVFDTDGEFLLSESVRIAINGEVVNTCYQHNEIRKLSTGNVLSVGLIPFVNNVESCYYNTLGDGLLHLVDAYGHTISVHTIDNFSINSVSEVSGGDLIFSGNRMVEVGSDSLIVPALIRTNSDLSIIWSKEFPVAPAANYFSSFCVLNNDEIVVLTQAIGGGFSGLYKLDAISGDVIFGKVYPVTFFSQKQTLEKTSDNGVIFQGRLLDTEGNFYLYLFKTNSEGNINGLVTQETCLPYLLDFETSIISHDFEIVEHSTFEFSDSFVAMFDTVQPESNTIDNIPFPTPFFHLPDQLCAKQCTVPTDLENSYADSQAWYVEGHEPEYYNTPSPGQLCWEEPGTYEVRQIISFQGCLDTFSQTISIVPEVILELPDSLTFCPDEEAELNPIVANADLFLWNTGDTEPSILAPATGLYTLTAENEECSATDSVYVQLNLSPELNFDILPADTAICLSDLAIEIAAETSPLGVGAWSDGSQDNPRLFYEFGTFAYTVDNEGCLYSDEITISEKDCSVKMYIPDAFSPNHDGINDVFEAEGSGFEVLEMRIYDRWGGLIYHTQNTAWKGIDTGIGVYTYVIKWRNEQTGEVGTEWGSLSLLR